MAVINCSKGQPLRSATPDRFKLLRRIHGIVYRRGVDIFHGNAFTDYAILFSQITTSLKRCLRTAVADNFVKYILGDFLDRMVEFFEICLFKIFIITVVYL